MPSGVYQIKNTVNGHSYVGSSLDIEKRKSEHVRALRRGRHHSRYFQRAFDSYGESVFIFSVLCACAPDDLLLYEQRFLDGLRPAYNILPTAGNRLGFKWSEEQRARASVLSKALGLRPPSQLGKTHVLSEEAKQRMAESNRGQKRSPEARKKMSDAAHKRKATPETRKKMSEGIKRSWHEGKGRS